MADKKKRRGRQIPIMRPHAAGMDIGAEEIYVAVPSDRDDQPVRCFGTFTCDLHALADWLQGAGLTRWPWNRPASIGFQSFRFWKREDSRCSS